MKKRSLNQAYGLLRSRASLAVIESKSSSRGLSLGKRLRLLLNGFLSESYIIYDLKNRPKKKFLTDFQRRKTRFINGSDSYVLSNKIVFDSLINKYVKTAKVLCTIIEGSVYSLDEKDIITDISSIMEYLSINKFLVFKPFIDSDGGKGIYIVRSESSNLYVNDQKVDRNELEKLIWGMNNYIACEFVSQGQYGEQLFNGSVNTIRIVTMIDPHNNEPFIAAAIQRIGTEQSKPVDNWSSGGLSALIDIETGRLGSAVSYPMGNHLSWHEVHPDTNSQIKGTVVPNWEFIKNKTLELSNKMPYLKYMGWDIVPLDGDMLIIEANNCTDVNLLQVHEPLLANERVYEFYKYHGII